MYRILCDGLPLYDLRDDNLVLNSPKVSLKENNSGSLDFTILPTHPHYDDIKKMKSVIQVFDGEDEIFCGRVIDETKDFHNRKKITCEGQLAYLNDSIQRPAVYHNLTVRGYLQKLLDVHNAQVSELNLGIKFNAQCAGESASWDYLIIYYVKDGKVYSIPKKRADDVAGKTVVIPSTEFYVYWHTDGSVHDFYGMKVDGVEITDAIAEIGSVSSVPKYTVTEVIDPSKIETAHSPYLDNSNLVWHYVHTIPKSYQTEKMFAVGSVTVVDNNDSIYKYTNWETTMQVIKTDLLDTYGGHLRIRKQDGIKYLDYLADYPNKNTQVIRFGENLLDFTHDIDATDIATAVIPLGAKSEESSIQGLEERLTIKSVNDDSDFVYSESAVNTYGWIFRTVTFDNVNVPDNLKRKGEQYLADIQFENVTLTVKAVDLHMLDVDVERIKMLDEIRVVSEQNGLDRFFPVTEMTINLDKPSNNTVTLGQKVSSGMTGTASSNNTSIMKKINDIPSEANILKEAQDNATQLIHSSLNGHVITKPDEILIMDTDDIETARKLWRWNLAGLGYSNTGYKGTFGLALTMDGQIVGDRIVGGSVSAEKLDVKYRTSVEKAISDAQDNAEEHTDEELKKYWTRTQVETAIQTSKNEILLSAKETATAYTDNKLKSYSTSAQIKVKTDSIETEVKKKLNSSELSTKIQQNASSVKIAWNNISKYIAFESGELRIYDSSVESTRKMRSKFNSEGSHFYRDNYYVGKIGTNSLASDSSKKGLNFDLETQGAYMTWASRDKSSDTSYTMKWTYVQNGKGWGDYTAGRIHAGCDIDMHYFTLRNVKFEGGGINGTLRMKQVLGISSDGTCSSWSNVKMQFKNGILISGSWNG